MEMIIIRDNRETYAASKCSLTSIHYHYQQRLLVLEKRFMIKRYRCALMIVLLEKIFNDYARKIKHLLP